MNNNSHWIKSRIIPYSIIIIVVGIIAWIALPELIDNIWDSAQQNAVSHIKQLGTAQINFQSNNFSTKFGRPGKEFAENIQQLYNNKAGKLISKYVAKAEIDQLGNKANPYQRYFFVTVKIENGKAINLKKSFAFCAFPNIKKSKEKPLTFYIDERGIIYHKYTAGVQVYDKAEIDSSWKSVY